MVISEPWHWVLIAITGVPAFASLVALLEWRRKHDERWRIAGATLAISGLLARGRWKGLGGVGRDHPPPKSVETKEPKAHRWWLTW